MDSKKPVSELSKTGLDRRVAADLESLTDPDGPLVQLVLEVKRSNSLAASNQQRMRWALIALALSLLGVGAIVHMISSATSNLQRIQLQQDDTARSLEKLTAVTKTTSEVVRDANEKIDNAPRIVADERTGGLKVVATVQHDEPSTVVPLRAQVAPPVSKKPRVAAAGKSPEPPAALQPDAALPRSIEIQIPLTDVEGL